MNATELLSAFKAGEESPPPALDGKALLRLVWRTWPFIRPVLKHVIALALIGIVSGVFWLGLTVLATDVFMNKILVGERIEAFQADLLRLDGEYVANGTEDEPLMTAEQRKTVRNRMVVWFGVGALVGLASLAALPYYQTWVKHRINQNLRVAMIERAEHLSLKYHDHAQVGDAVFRVYQDSAMIVNLIDEAIVGPLAMLYALASGIVFISFFSPHVALGMILMAVPMVWLTVKFTPSPHFSPGAVMIAEDFGPVVHNGHVRVLATESIAGTTVEGARARHGPVCTRPVCTRGQKTREGAASAVRHRHDHRHRGQTSETQELFDADKRPGEKCGLGSDGGPGRTGWPTAS